MNTSGPPTPLGALEQLPAEIRLQVYRECVSQRSAAALTRTSQAIHDELNACQYDDFVLTFDIHPGNPDSSVVMLNGEGSSWSSNPATVVSIATGDHHVKDKDETGPIPFERFKAINIDVHCPNATDPGQLVRGWQQVTRFLEWLLPQWTQEHVLPRGQYDIFPARCNTSLNLPDVHLRFVGTEWVDAGTQVRFQHSVVGPVADAQEGQQIQEDAADMAHFKESDLQILLLPFLYLRHARRMTVHLPPTVEALHNAGLRSMIDQVTTLACSETDFGLDWDRDSAIQTQVGTWHTWLTDRLDALEGCTAAQLRRTQTYLWCFGHGEALYLQLYGKFGGFDHVRFGSAAGSFSLDQMTQLLDNEIDRENETLMLGPRMSLFLEAQESPSSSGYHASHLPPYEQYYPDGIPPRSSTEREALLADRNSRFGGVGPFWSFPVPFPCAGCEEYLRRRVVRLNAVAENGCGYDPGSVFETDSEEDNSEDSETEAEDMEE